jgi:hypothetical protein
LSADDRDERLMAILGSRMLEEQSGWRNRQRLNRAKAARTAWMTLA